MKVQLCEKHNESHSQHGTHVGWAHCESIGLGIGQDEDSVINTAESQQLMLYCAV